jgi:catechol 2,3-dioxygenase
VEAELARLNADPLYQWIRQRREQRSSGWLVYIGYTRDKPVKSDSISETEKAVATMQKKIDEIRSADDGKKRQGMRNEYVMNNQPIDPRVRIGHVHLKVADLERALKFYCGVLGFALQQRYGTEAAFISAGGYHHHIGLNTWESKGGSPPPPGSTGLFHTAILYPTRALLADALRRVLTAGIELDGASDHGVSEALYLRDPDNNGVELYWDRPESEWPRSPGGELAMFTHPLDLEKLLRERGPVGSKEDGNE